MSAVKRARAIDFASTMIDHHCTFLRSVPRVCVHLIMGFLDIRESMRLAQTGAAFNRYSRDPAAAAEGSQVSISWLVNRCTADLPLNQRLRLPAALALRRVRHFAMVAFAGDFIAADTAAADPPMFGLLDLVQLNSLSIIFDSSTRPDCSNDEHRRRGRRREREYKLDDFRQLTVLSKLSSLRLLGFSPEQSRQPPYFIWEPSSLNGLSSLTELDMALPGIQFIKLLPPGMLHLSVDITRPSYGDADDAAHWFDLMGRTKLLTLRLQNFPLSQLQVHLVIINLSQLVTLSMLLLAEPWLTVPNETKTGTRFMFVRLFIN
jgi:hypothetical protein